MIKRNYHRKKILGLNELQKVLRKEKTVRGIDETWKLKIISQECGLMINLCRGQMKGQVAGTLFKKTISLVRRKSVLELLLLLSCLFNHHAVKLKYDIAVLFGVTQSGRASK